MLADSCMSPCVPAKCDIFNQVRLACHACPTCYEALRKLFCIDFLDWKNMVCEEVRLYGAYYITYSHD